MKPILLAAALIAAPAVAAPAVNWSKGAPVAITVTNDRFIPDRVTLRQGRQYVLTIHNRSNRKHNFAAGSFFKYARVAPRDSGWVTHDEVRLAPGQRATLHIFAPDTPNASYKFRSTRIEDAAEKMKGTIYVQ
jgi:FtsP/CotA-like multicopper oxidase with cupredoxin domain